MENKSSASHEQIMPAGKPSASFITNAGKSGELGDNPISVNTNVNANSDSSTNKATESFASKGSDATTGGKSMMPAGEPSSTFINTNAVK